MLGPLCLLADINFGRNLAVLLMLGSVCFLADINFDVDAWATVPSGGYQLWHEFGCGS
jgi:hypothetical protein